MVFALHTLINPESLEGIRLIQLFLLVAAAQGFIIGLVILSRKSGDFINSLLAIAFLILSFRLAVYPFRELLEENALGQLSDISLIALLAVGPLIFLFINHKINRRTNIHTCHLFHIVPLVLYLIDSLTSVFSLYICTSYATLYSAMIYGGLSLFAIARTISGTSFFKSPTPRLYSLAIPLMLIPISIHGLVPFSEPILNLHPATFPYLVLTFLFYRMGFKAAFDSRKFLSDLLDFKPDSTAVIDTGKLSHLIQIIEGKKLYLNPGLTISEVSRKSGLSRHVISDLLNQGLGKNFNQLVNDYRLDIASQNLICPEMQYLSIAGIANESGFNSKSTFNQLFKKHYGMTPSEYQRRHLSK